MGRGGIGQSFAKSSPTTQICNNVSENVMPMSLAMVVLDKTTPSEPD